MSCGDAEHYDRSDPNMGIMPRVIDRLFQEIDGNKQVSCELHASYVEIYNDEIFDLLSPDTDMRNQSKIRIVEESVTKNVTVLGVAEEKVYNV